MNVLSSLRFDAALQFRHGFYGVYAVVIVIYGVLLRVVPSEFRPRLLVLTVFSDPMVFGFYFVNALLFMERRQGVLDALFVTPLSAERYLASKMASMALLGSFGALGIVLVSQGPGAPFLRILAAVVPTACFSTLAGIIIGARFKDFFSFIGVGSLFLLPAALPTLRLVGFPDHPLYLLLPGTPFLMLFEAVYLPLAPGLEVYAWSVSAGLVVLAFPWAAAALRRYVLSRIGGGG